MMKYKLKRFNLINTSRKMHGLAENRCAFLLPQSDDITGDLPKGRGFGERRIYIFGERVLFAKIGGKE